MDLNIYSDPPDPDWDDPEPHFRVFYTLPMDSGPWFGSLIYECISAELAQALFEHDYAGTGAIVDEVQALPF